MLCKLTYALTADGKTIHISEADGGLSCNCICPACGDALIARKGNQVEHHFAHTTSTDCPYGFTSSIYYAIMRKINELGYIVLPPYTKNRAITENGSGIRTIMPRAKVKVDRVEPTKRASKGVTGLAVTCSGKTLLLKLLTTYNSTQMSRSKIEALDMPMLELDLSRDDIIDNDIIHEMLTTAPKQLYWVYNKRAENIWEELLSKCEKISVSGSGNKIYTYGCPIPQKRIDGFLCYIKTSCAACEFFFGLYGTADNQYVMCGRRHVITEAGDLNLSLDARKKKYSIRY